MISSKKGKFQQKVLGHKYCSFDKPNEKISTKRPSFLAHCPKMQDVKKTKNRFFRSLVSSKSSDGQVKKQYWLPSGKSFVQSPEICGSVFDTDEKAPKLLLFFR